MAVIAGNWKMHMGAAQTRAFFAELDLDESAGAEGDVLAGVHASLQFVGSSA